MPDQLHPNSLALAGDVLNVRQMEQVFEKAVQKFGSLDGVVANAGSGSLGTVLETPMQERQDQFQIKAGSVPESDMAAVSASRAAVKQVAYMLAGLLAPKINVNTVNIGVIDTERQFAKYKKADCR